MRLMKIKPGGMKFLAELSAWIQEQNIAKWAEGATVEEVEYSELPQCAYDLLEFVPIEPNWQPCGVAILPMISGSVHVEQATVPQATTDTTAIRAMAPEVDDSKKMEICTFCSKLPFPQLGTRTVAKPGANGASLNIVEVTRPLLTRTFRDVFEKAEACAVCLVIALQVLSSTSDAGIEPSAAGSQSPESNVDPKERDFALLDRHFQFLYTELMTSRESTREWNRLSIPNRLVVELQFMVSPSRGPKTTLSTIQFQKCSPDQGILTCEPSRLFSEDSENLHLFEGRIRPDRLDGGLLRAWKDHCFNHHGESCAMLVTPPCSQMHLRLIDVNNECIVDSNETEQWVALSYVWGKSNKFVVTKENIEKYREPGSLAGATSATIADAMAVTKLLGERYLWVDSLCILQDCLEDMQYFIPRMGYIYGQSCFTIINAHGLDGTAGLPGVRPSTREEHAHIIVTPDFAFMKTSDPAHSSKWDCTLGSTWSTRAWTLQERLLSRRVLIFTSGLIYWECQKASWNEETFKEVLSDHVISHHPDLGDADSLSHHMLSRVLRTRPFDFANTYRHIASRYTGLQLSFQKDGLNAISGLVRSLAYMSGHEFVWALPVTFLSTALAWETYSSERHSSSVRNYRRAPNHSLANKRERMEAYSIPSWSWVGWEGKIWYPSPKGGGFTHSELCFYHFTDKRTPNLLTGLEQTNRSSTPFWESPGWNVSGETALTEAHIPSGIPSRLLIDRVLGFWTDTVLADISWKDTDSPWRSYFHDSKMQAELHVDGVNIMSAWSQIPTEVNPHSQESGVLIVIGTKPISCFEDQGWVQRRHLDVLLVNIEDQVAYRRGLCHISESDWLRLGSRRWKPIFLG
ncbi:hypothetical protein LTS17_003503 [Exophiala oligosperma]